MNPPEGKGVSNPLSRTIVGVCLLAVAGSLIAYAATGMHAYTRFRDAEIEATNAETGLADLFADAGDGAEEPGAVESVNAIGLLPSGPGAASISVVTITGPAVAAIGFVWWSGRRKKTGSPDGPSGP